MDKGGPETFVRITNEDVWRKLGELEKKVDRLNGKIWAFSTALVIVTAFLSLTGGISFGS